MYYIDFPYHLTPSIDPPVPRRLRANCRYYLCVYIFFVVCCEAGFPDD